MGACVICHFDFRGLFNRLKSVVVLRDVYSQ